ncbi:MAG: homocysteine S-methyltransferase family protein [Phycisphaerae bacterium]|nr:homocysteine S-methyltransferase family protein [Phycisphaerae bacterium]
MGALLDTLAKKKILVSDGAWGTMLQSRGLTSDDCPEEWNVSHPDDVRAIAASYVRAGSDMILTNTFGGSRVKLDKKKLGDRAAEFNRAGATLSMEVAGSAIVAGSVGPTGEFLQPMGLLSEEQMQAFFSEQIEAILSAGVRVICVETMMALEEAACAVKAAKALDASVEVLATMTFEKGAQGHRTMMGVSPSQAVAGLTDAGADVVGSNCGNGIEGMIEIAAQFRAETDKPILVHANAGVPQLIGGKTVFRQSPADFAANVKALIDAGANIVGGCCGTTPDHIRAMIEVVNTLR